MGSLLLVTKKGAEAVRILEDNGIPAVVIGRLRKDHDKRILNGEECQSLNRPEPDALTGMIEQGNAKYCD
jgi:selenophosphate synthetase-related protein